MTITWQDAVLSFGGLGFAVALIPTIRGQEKPATSTCAFTSGMLFAQAMTLSTLDLYVAAGANAITAIGWFVLLLQRGLRDRKL